MKILHLITGLGIGGAESALNRLLVAMDRERFEPVVVSLMAGGPIRDSIEAEGIPVHSLDMKRSLPSLSAMMKFRRIVRRERPEILQGWMYHGNIAALTAKIWAPGKVPVIWNVRQSVYDLSLERPMTAQIIRLGAATSFMPSRIVYNSKVSRAQHQALGYKMDRSITIPNGFDTMVFQPNARSRSEIREEFGIGGDVFVVGMIGRFDPMKDHGNFLRAAAHVLAATTNVRFVMAGKGVDAKNGQLTGLIDELGLRGFVHMLGERNDTPRLNATFDLAVLSSNSEGFPNVVGEAMATSVPCVVTDVGDAAYVLGDYGRVVPSNDSEALGQAILEMRRLPSAQLMSYGKRARLRIQSQFAVDTIAKQYEEMYEEVYRKCAVLRDI